MSRTSGEDEDRETAFEVARRFGALSLTAVFSAGLGISAVKVVEEMTGFATAAALGLFVSDSRTADLGPDGNAYRVLGTEALFEGDLDKLKITLYRCTSPGTDARGKSVYTALVESGTFGRVEYQAIALEDDGEKLFRGVTTLVYDAALTERREIPAIWQAVPEHESIQVLPNASGRSKWFLSLFVC